MTEILSSLQKCKPYAGILMFACLYACLVVHLSLYPYTDWRSIGIGPFEFLTGPWIPVHQKMLWTDVAVNVAGYIPLGFLLLIGLSRTFRPLEKARVIVLCGALSFALESLQTYLPSRVPSKVDLLTNIAGSILGCLIAMWALRRKARIQNVNFKIEHWLIQRSWVGMGLLTLWFLSILAPQNPAFSTGLWLGNFLDLQSDSTTATPFGISPNAILWIESTAPIFINYCFLVCAWMLGLAQTHRGAPRLRLLFILIGLTLVIRLLDTLVYNPFDTWNYLIGLWFENNTNSVLIATIFTIAIAKAPIGPHQIARIGLLHLMGGWSVTFLLPGVYDPELEIQAGALLTLFHTTQEAGRWVSELWPIVALTVLTFLSRPEQGFRP